MRLTASKLRQIIREELTRSLNEGGYAPKVGTIIQYTNEHEDGPYSAIVDKLNQPREGQWLGRQVRLVKGPYAADKLEWELTDTREPVTSTYELIVPSVSGKYNKEYEDTGQPRDF